MISIYNNISDFILILNYDKEIIFCNKSFLNRLNYNMEEVISLNIENILNKNFNINKELKNTCEMNKTLEFYSKSNDLVTIDTTITVENYKNEKAIFIIGKEVNSKPYTIEMLEDLLDNINMGAFIIDKDGKYLYINNTFSKVFDKKREEVIGTYNKVHWEPSVYNKFKKNNNEVFNDKKPSIFNEELNYGGSTYYYENYKAPIFDKNGSPKYIVATAKNITLSKSVTEQLWSNYNKIPIDCEYNIKNDNNNPILNNALTSLGENILDYTKADGLSLLLYDKNKNVLTPIIKLKHFKKILKDIEFFSIDKNNMDFFKNDNYCNCILPKNKIPKLLYNQSLLTNELDYCGSYKIELFNEFIGVICLGYKHDNSPPFNSDEYMKYICNKIAMIIKNIRLSNQVSIENKKRKYSERELERYLNISVDLVSIIGKNEYIKKLSNSWQNVLGWTEKELLSMPITNIIHPKDLESFKDKIHLANQEGKITRNIIRFRHKNGSYIFLEWSSEYLSKEEIYITTARDITKKIEFENEKILLEETIKLQREKNEFFSNISHEFRTPINIILGTTQVMNKNLSRNQMNRYDLNKYINYIKQNSYRLLKLVNNSIDISKMDIGSYELRCSNKNIISIVEDITLSVVDYTKNNKINLIFDTDCEEIITYCDPDKIERIILNLLSNAIKYTPENGYIKVNITTTSEIVTVSIKDSGIGIPQEKLSFIFDKFGQVDSSFNRLCEGSGIGLSIVKNLVEMHGGNIYAKSIIGEGSEFIFTIPIKIEKEINFTEQDMDRKCKHVERCEIEFSDIYNV